MTRSSSLSAHTAMADALAAMARNQAAADPNARGADWRTATVTALGNDGTVQCGIIWARRLSTYISPAVGDLVVLTQSSSGNWLALGRTATTSSAAGEWQPIPLSGGWVPFSSTYYTPSYRLNGDGTASLSGLADAPSGISGPATLATLPEEAWPAHKVRVPAQVSGSSVGVLDINADGRLQINDYSGDASWVTLDAAARYRLI